jgi:hypothetical protein
MAYGLNTGHVVEALGPSLVVPWDNIKEYLLAKH